MDYEARLQHLLDTQVKPWVDKLPWQDTHPLRFDASEGYKGNGVIGARAGPIEAIDFPNVAHEMAHAIEILECDRIQALSRPSWGLEIKTVLRIGRESFREPITMQATTRETQVCGIQWRILEMVGHPDVENFANYHAQVLLNWMPDNIMGGKNDAQRLRLRERLIKEAYLQWPAARVEAGWRRVQPKLDAVALLAMKKDDHAAKPRRMGRR